MTRMSLYGPESMHREMCAYVFGTGTALRIDFVGRERDDVMALQSGAVESRWLTVLYDVNGTQAHSGMCA